jgi:hypothetical protein
VIEIPTDDSVGEKHVQYPSKASCVTSLKKRSLAMRGSRPGERRGGRQCGTKNKLTLVRECAQLEAAEKIALALGAEALPGCTRSPGFGL